MSRRADARADLQRDTEHMLAALALAGRGEYDAKPNPAVGCVLVNDGKVVGSGWSAPAGGPHAEIVALREAGEAARGATAYTTLEPCAHQGRTGPCTRALIAAGVARVVYAADDPNPRAGGGARELAAAGVEIVDGVLEDEAAALYRGFFARMRRGRPWVVVKIAASLDGRTALANGASRWITGELARRDVHRWRARSGAVLTGSGTIVADDPALTARLDAVDLAGRGLKQPLRAIVDTRLVTPTAAKAVTGEGGALVFTMAAGDYEVAKRRALEAAGARIERVGRAGGAEGAEGVEGERYAALGAVLERLAELEVNDVLVEAGPRLNGALLAAGLVDEVVVYFAPLLLGDGARAMAALPGIAALGDGVRLVIDDVRPFGVDLRIVARPVSVGRQSAPV